MKKILLMLMLAASQLLAQSSDKSGEFARIEQRLAEVKKNSSASELKNNRTAFSDIENRKNSLKMMLKTPDAERNEEWNNKWNKEVKLIEDKLSKLNSNSK